MKKSLHILALAGLLLTGCMAGDYGIKPAGPQAWEQEEAVVLPSEAVVSPVDPIDLAKVEGDSVAVAAYTPLELKEGEAKLSLTIKGENNYSYEVAADMKLSVADLQSMVEKDFGKRPVERTFSAELSANVMVEGQASLIKSTPFNIQLIPEAPFIDKAYYIIGDMNGWDGEKARNFQFKHSGKDVYEDPVFSLVVEVPDNCHWKVVPQGNFDAGNVWREGEEGILGVAVNGDEAASGSLTTTKPGAAKIPAAGMYTIALNMMDYTYTVAPMASEYYLVGALNGWNAGADGKYCLLYPESATVFQYTTQWTGDHNFKVWAGADFGNWDKAVGTAVDGDTSPEGKLGGGGAIKVPTGDEYYTVTFDMAAKTYKSVKLENQAPKSYEHIGLIGDFNGWGGDAELTMKTPHNWVIRDLKIEANGGLKFRANHDWGINWGAKVNIADINYGVGAQNGDNIGIPAGTYDVFFNDITGHFVFLSK